MPKIVNECSDCKATHRQWQQGDYAVECGPLILRCVPESTDGEELDAVTDSQPNGFVVISQTCDIVKCPKKWPFVSVCPLIEIDNGRLQDVRSGRAPTLGLLSTLVPNMVADFSRTMTITKELLISWKRQRGCNTEKEKERFARALEFCFGRYAFPDDFARLMSPLREKIAKIQKLTDEDKGKKTLKSIREIRIHPCGGWFEEGRTSIIFYVLLEREKFREIKDRKEIESQFSTMIKVIEWNHLFDLKRLQISEYSDINAEDYVSSFPLDINFLSFAPRYGE